MSYEFNIKRIAELGDKFLYLLDSSAYIRLEELSQMTNCNFLEMLHTLSKNSYFFLTNEVVVELMNGPRICAIETYLEHVINAEVSMDKSWKENRFIIEESGQLKYLILNRISSTDYGQIHLCQNHRKLNLVSNDRKMLKSAKTIIEDRCLGIDKLLDELLKRETLLVETINTVKQALEKNYAKKIVV